VENSSKNTFKPSIHAGLKPVENSEKSALRALLPVDNFGSNQYP